MILTVILMLAFLAALYGIWQWHATRSDPASYPSSSGFALFEQSLSANKI